MKTEFLKIIREAGQIILDAHDINNHIKSKQGNANFVTEYDYKVQAYLIQRLSEVVPDAVFLGEEGEEHKSTLQDNCFIIDPIDGTSNFIFDYRHSSISVALYHRGRIEFGAVYNPYLDEMFFAEKGRGAFLSRNNQSLNMSMHSIKEHDVVSNDKKVTADSSKSIDTDNEYAVTPIHVLDLHLDQGIAGIGTAPYYRDMADKTFEMTRKIFNKAMDIRRSGSAALDICYVAAGRFVLFAEYVLQPWDYAAASLIVEEAGGKITTLEGEALKFDKTISILAASPNAYEDFYKL